MSAFAKLRALFTASIIFPAIVVFILHGLLIKLFIRSKLQRRQALLRNMSAYSRFALRVMRIRVSIHGLNLDLMSRENFLFVSNHMSYLDMMVMASTHTSVFVTSVDMGEVPFLGTIAEISGALFIERRHRERLGQDVLQLENALNEGFHVTLFPEGTSTDGSSVLPFKRGLLTAAPRAKHRIIPMALRYTAIDGVPFGPANRDRVCWYGSMSFLPHLLSVFSLNEICAELSFQEPLSFAPETPKDTLAITLHEKVASCYSQSMRTEESEASSVR